MKTRTALLIMLFSFHSIFAQENNSVQQSHNWFVGLNYSVLNFNQRIDNNFVTLSLERKLNEHFSISLNGGIGSVRLQEISRSYFSNYNETPTFETVRETFNPFNRVSLNLAVKYSPFDWAISPYLIYTYGIEYDYSSDYKTNRVLNTYNKNGTLINSVENNSTAKMASGFYNKSKIGIGASANIISNFYLDGNVLYNGADSFSGTLGIKLGL
ncbi:MAG: hypothetical protein Q8S39_14885 [Ignavibacteria bacterium]|nr:hypothetical protein [Ignavibacteria bacterium]